VTEPALFTESGSTWWPVLWGPAFAALGAALEAVGGRVHWVAWLITGVGLAAAAAGWTRTRRRLLSVRLTPATLRQGPESLPVRRIAEVDGVRAPARARVLGGGLTVPRRFAEVAVRLDDGSVVLAWARDGDGLREALRGLVIRPQVE
jgi:hypothetical protein